MRRLSRGRIEASAFPVVLDMVKLAGCLLLGCSRFLVYAKGSAPREDFDWWTVCRRCRRIM